jgi:hypothetical protein
MQYYPQPIVETYIDSLISYLSRQMGGDSVTLDQTTQDYIEHFASLATHRSKCVYYRGDSILIHEKVEDELTNAYMIIPSENLLVSRSADEQRLIEQPYFLERDPDRGFSDYEVTTDRTDSKLIEGFLCYRVEVLERFHHPDQPEPAEKKYILYVTDDINLPGGFILGVNMSRIIGCPLEIQEPLNSKVRITYRATGMRLSTPEGIFQSL